VKIYKQWYNSFGDELFVNYFSTKKKAINKRSHPFITPEIDDPRWSIEEIDVN